MNRDLTRAATKRAEYTGEQYSAALQALRVIGAQPSLIPHALSQQALLETDILLALNTAAYILEDDDNSADEAEKLGNLMLISRVHPRSESITLDVQRPQLAALIPSLLPYSEGPDDDNVMGVPGLRAIISDRGNRLLLYRPGEQGVAQIRVIDDSMQRHDWRELLKNLRRTLDTAYHIWHSSPKAWADIERPAHELFSEDRSKSSWLCSGILRRLNIFRTSGNPIPRWVDVWNGHLEEGINLQVEWPNGPSESRIQSLLLDIECGMQLKVVSKDRSWIKLRSLDHEKAGQIVLRHNLALSDDSYSPD
ncbi:hypothetical protein ACIBQX_46135 [Nonomuraea sp. NPDC049714]|uniref:hypothetical protein n=1 Tax=Nonomuraea sp. NPDC049714 TaxID=3364357 RepID=UPI00378D8585